MSSGVAGTEIGLTIRVEQFDADHLTCDYCDKLASTFVSTGADPDRTPCCYTHAAHFLEVSAAVFRRFGGEDVSPPSETAA